MKPKKEDQNDAFGEDSEDQKMKVTKDENSEEKPFPLSRCAVWRAIHPRVGRVVRPIVVVII